MKFLGLLIFLPILSYSQDIIVKNNGQEMDVIILEVKSLGVKCKQFRDPEGPTYFIPVNKISEIKYEYGRVLSFENRGKGYEKLKTSEIVLWCGLDFSKAKMIGTREFGNRAKDINDLVSHGFNNYIFNEPNKYHVKRGSMNKIIVVCSGISAC